MEDGVVPVCVLRAVGVAVLLCFLRLCLLSPVAAGIDWFGRNILRFGNVKGSRGEFFVDTGAASFRDSGRDS